MKYFLISLLLVGALGAHTAESISIFRTKTDLTAALVPAPENNHTYVVILFNEADVLAAAQAASNKKQTYIIEALKEAVARIQDARKTPKKTDTDIDNEATAEKADVDTKATRLKNLKPDEDDISTIP